MPCESVDDHSNLLTDIDINISVNHSNLIHNIIFTYIEKEKKYKSEDNMNYEIKYHSGRKCITFPNNIKIYNILQTFWKVL